MGRWPDAADQTDPRTPTPAALDRPRVTLAPMAPIDRQRLDRIDEILTKGVKPARWPATSPVEIRANHLRGEPVPYREAVAGSFVPFKVGDAWGPLWDTTWFHVTGAVPDDWGDDLDMDEIKAMRAKKDGRRIAGIL